MESTVKARDSKAKTLSRPYQGQGQGRNSKDQGQCQSFLNQGHDEQTKYQYIYINYEIVHEAYKKENKVIDFTIT